MKKTCLLLFILPFLFPLILCSQSKWMEISTVEDVCSAYPERMKILFQTLNLESKGLENVKKAYESNNIPLASSLLLDYFKESNTAKLFLKKQPLVSQKTNSEADSIIQDIFTFYLLPDSVPRLANGHLDWSCTGPDKDIEWAWALNRHYPVNTLLKAWYETGNPVYPKYIEKFIKDWLISSWPYPGVKSSTAMWRGLEVSFRVKAWVQVFYGLLNTNYISPATRLLMLSSLPEHAHYARNFHAQNNWLTMEISGLASVASFWPEFSESPSWLEYSIKTMTESMKGQVYPDGVRYRLRLPPKSRMPKL